MKEFVCNKVANFQASILLKVNISTCTFQGLCQLFRKTYFKKLVLMAASTIYFFKLFLLSPEQVRKLVRLSRKVIPKSFKLFVRPHYDHRDITYDQT